MRRLLKKKRENAFKDFHVYYNDHNKIIYYLYYHIYCHSLQVFLSFLYSQKPNRRFRIFSETTQNFLFFIFLWRTKEKKRMKRGINLGFVDTIYEEEEEEDYVDHSSSFSSSSSSISPSPQPRINLSSSSMELESRLLKW